MIVLLALISMSEQEVFKIAILGDTSQALQTAKTARVLITGIKQLADLTIADVKTDKIQAETELNTLKTKSKLTTKQVKAEVKTAEVSMKVSMQKALGVSNIVVGTVQGVIGAIGIQISPMTQCVLDIIMASVSSALSLAAMWSSNPYTLALGIAMTSIALSTQIMATLQTYQSMMFAQLMQNFAMAQMINAGDAVGAAFTMMRGM